MSKTYTFSVRLDEEKSVDDVTTVLNEFGNVEDVVDGPAFNAFYRNEIEFVLDNNGRTGVSDEVIQSIADDLTTDERISDVLEESILELLEEQEG